MSSRSYVAALLCRRALMSPRSYVARSFVARSFCGALLSRYPANTSTVVVGTAQQQAPTAIADLEVFRLVTLRRGFSSHHTNTEVDFNACTTPLV
jgi:hypothetical protein